MSVNGRNGECKECLGLNGGEELISLRVSPSVTFLSIMSRCLNMKKLARKSIGIQAVSVQAWLV